MRARVWLTVCLLTLAGAALRWFGLDDNPLWLDEIISLNRATLPTGELIRNSLLHLHYPSYFLLLQGAIAWLGDSNVALRLPSLLAGALGIPLAYSAAGRIAGQRAGIAAAILFALSPILVMYSQEARSYALALLLMTVALWGFARLATNATEAAVGLRALFRPARRVDVSSRTSWAAWTGGTAGALIVLNIAVFWLVTAIAGFVLLRRELCVDERRRFDRTLLAALGVVAAIWLPWGIALAPTVLNTAQNGFWAPPVTLASFAHAIWVVYLFGVSEPLGFEPLTEQTPLPALIMTVAAIAGAYSLRRRPAIFWMLIGTAALPPLALLLMSLITPVLVPRYLLAGVPAFILLAGVGIARLFEWLSRKQALTTLVASVALLDLSSSLLEYHRSETKPRWDHAAFLLADSLHESDRILFHDGFARWIVETNLRRSGSPLAEQAILRSPEALEPADFRGRVWVAYGRVGHAAGPGDTDIRNWLSSWGEPAEIRAVGRQVRIALFEFTPPRSLYESPPTSRPPRKLRSRRSRS